MFNTHVYSFNGELFLQNAGGLIGLRSTCVVARVTMNEWDARWQEILRQNNIKIRAGDRYMDDIRAFLNSLKAGWRWHEGYICFTETWKIGPGGCKIFNKEDSGSLDTINELGTLLSKLHQ